MKLNDFASGIEQRSGLADFFLQVIDVRAALFVVEGDDGGAAAEPAKCLTKGNVKVEREIALGGTIVFEDALGQFGPRQGVGEFRGRRIGGVARAGDIVLLDEIK